jgi:hypothetical protein
MIVVAYGLSSDLEELCVLRTVPQTCLPEV